MILLALAIIRKARAMRSRLERILLVHATERLALVSSHD